MIEANHRISDAIEREQNLDGMGTTLTALRFVGSQVGLVHVGDSRAYLLRGELLSQITHDDTYVQYLVDSGELTPDEAKDHPRKSVILRTMNGAAVEPDVSIREARAGDRYLLCSDGLSDVVSTDTILETLHIPDPQECADRLVELALRSGGPDNVTVIVADVVNAQPGDVIDDVPVVRGPSSTRRQLTSRGRTPRPNGPRTSDARAAPAAGQRGDTAPAPLAGPRHRGRNPHRAGRCTGWHVRLGPDAVLRRPGRHRGGDLSRVNAAFGPLKFSEVYQNTDLRLRDLNSPGARRWNRALRPRTRATRTASSPACTDELLPVCRLGIATPTASPSPSPSSTPWASSPSAGPVTRSASASHSTTSSAAQRRAGVAPPRPPYARAPRHAVRPGRRLRRRA